jgi:hypothetical protein
MDSIIYNVLLTFTCIVGIVVGNYPQILLGG